MSIKVLRFTKNTKAASKEIASNGGRIVQQFSPEVFVAELPDSTDLSQFLESSSNPESELDNASRLAVDAWNNSNRGEAKRVPKAPSATEGLGWDTPGYDSPLEFFPPPQPPVPPSTLSEVSQSTGTPTSRYMIGTVAVGLILVTRDTGLEVMTKGEQTKVIQEVQEGLDWLATLEPRAKVSFIYDIRLITITTPAGPYLGPTDSFEIYERDWRDDALAVMGYPSGRAGYQQYANELRADKGTDWSYVSFFTKYPLHHFAYAIYEKVVMNIQNDGWGPDNINRVFAHETCHIFGAADEYGSCSCSTTSGHLNIKNGNCKNCFPPGAQLKCLMNANTLEMCEYSRRQIGWDNSLFP